MTKEIKAINDALNAYYEKYNGNCVINASVFAFDNNGEATMDDDHIWGAGNPWKQECNLDIMMEEYIKTEKEKLNKNK
tara:strand:- start:1008 stop:1241 length:234 start_codon:yes stop_codon:yes gene_type:complete